MEEVEFKLELGALPKPKTSFSVDGAWLRKPGDGDFEFLFTQSHPLTGMAAMAVSVAMNGLHFDMFKERSKLFWEDSLEGKGPLAGRIEAPVEHMQPHCPFIRERVSFCFVSQAVGEVEMLFYYLAPSTVHAAKQAPETASRELIPVGVVGCRMSSDLARTLFTEIYS